MLRNNSHYRIQESTPSARARTVIYFQNFGLMTVFEVILVRYDF